MSVIIAITPFIIAGVTSLVSGVAVLSSDNDNNQDNKKSITLPTNIRNEELLQKALRNLGANIVRNADNVTKSDVDDFHVVFQRTSTGVFEIKFTGNKNEVDNKEANAFRDELQEEYGRVIQDYVYTQLKQKAEEKGLSLEKEAVQKDQSIVLTYNINSNG